MKPREKYKQYGLNALAIGDLIACIVGSGGVSADVWQLSASVAKYLRKESYDKIRFGKFLKTVDGIGEVKSLQLLAGIELGGRVLKLNSTPAKIVKDSKSAYQELKYLRDRTQEHVVTLFLNARYELLGKKTISIGSVNASALSPRDIIIPALEKKAIAVLLAHNHPSQSLEISREDFLMTKRIQLALELVGMTLIDHIVIAGDRWRSIEVSHEVTENEIAPDV